jgi:hypothetical protein
MTTTTTIDLVHLVQVVTDPQLDGLGHRAECSCGWAGDWTADQATAEAAGVDHREVAVGPGDGLDAVMSELLDIQDALADVVVWLAENWSADLPVPTVYASGGGGSRRDATVEVWAYCDAPSDLARIAHLLGVPPADPGDADSVNPQRYREARRLFGRVVLRAYAPSEGAGS